MKIFVTGATGFIGSAIVEELLGAGHQVLGLARSDASAKKLTDAGAQVHRGDVEDVDSLKHGAAASDGVIHCGFIHNFSDFAGACETDRRAIEALGEALIGSDRPLVITSGTALITPGRVATEDDATVLTFDKFPRVASEEAADAVAERGVRASVVRLSPSVHGEGDYHGFISILIKAARSKGASAYVGDGSNRWTAVHRLDAAHLFRLAVEKGTTGARYHGADEEGIPFREIAEAIGKGLNVPVVSIRPVEVGEQFDPFTAFVSQLDAPASNQLTRERLGWQPTQVKLIPDIEQGHYFG